MSDRKSLRARPARGIQRAVNVQQATTAAVRTSRNVVEEQVAGDYCAAGYVRTRCYGPVPAADWAAYVATTDGDDR